MKHAHENFPVTIVYIPLPVQAIKYLNIYVACNKKQFVMFVYFEIYSDNCFIKLLF